MTKKELYRKFCADEESLPIFSKDWWLDAVCGDDWDVCLVEKEGQILATLPYFQRKNKLRMHIISLKRHLKSFIQ